MDSYALLLGSTLSAGTVRCVVWLFSSAVVVQGACTGHRVLPSANVPRLRLLLYFAAGSTRRPVHWGALLVYR